MIPALAGGPAGTCLHIDTTYRGAETFRAPR